MEPKNTKDSCMNECFKSCIKPVRILLRSTDVRGKFDPSDSIGIRDKIVLVSRVQ